MIWHIVMLILLYHTISYDPGDCVLDASLDASIRHLYYTYV